MKPRSIVTLGLLAVIFLVGCAPAESATPAQPVLQETAPPAPPTSTPTAAQPQPLQTEEPPQEAPTAAPQAVATSRGPNLEATDPSTVNLASGELQFVEFFRFT